MKFCCTLGFVHPDHLVRLAIAAEAAGFDTVSIADHVVHPMEIRSRYPYSKDGERGWDALCAAHYDLLVTDNDMPCLTGLRLIARLRVAGFTLPVIVASGSLELGEVNDYPLLDLAAILHKPFGFADLISVARRVAPIAPDAGEGVVHCLELHCDGSIPFPFPARRDARPGVFAQTA